MAGIGFELRQILARPGYLNLFQAYGYAALIGSGPWVFSILSLAVLGIVLRGMTTASELQLFFLTVTYIYGASLIITGPAQMVLTRYAADQHFSNQKEKIFPAIVTLLAFSSAFNSLVGLVVFLAFVPAPLLFQLAAAHLFFLVSSIWIASIYLSAVKNYRAVLFSFFLGYGVSFLAAWALTKRFGPSGSMLGMVFGHLLLLLLILAAIYKEIGEKHFLNFEIFSYFRKYADLALCGLFYNAGIWVDKILFWFLSPDRVQVAGFLHASPVYDQVVYLSFLSLAPGMAVFLLKFETDFAAKHEQYVQLVLRKGTYSQIVEVKNRLVLALQTGLIQLIKVQGIFTVLLILFADRLLQYFGLGAVQTGVFQVATLGVFLLVLFLSLMTVFFYLGQLHDAMLCALIFATVNASVTLWSIRGGEQWYGFGFLIASAVATVAAALKVNSHLRWLEYHTFTSQTAQF